MESPQVRQLTHRSAARNTDTLHAVREEGRAFAPTSIQVRRNVDTRESTFKFAP
jgi:hypothetical protein